MKTISLICLFLVTILTSGYSALNNTCGWNVIEVVCESSKTCNKTLEINYISDEEYKVYNGTMAMTYDEYGGCVYRKGNCFASGSKFVIIQPISSYSGKQ